MFTFCSGTRVSTAVARVHARAPLVVDYKLFMRMGGAHGKGKGDVAYTAFPASTLAAVSGAGECTILSVGTGKATVVKADKVRQLFSPKNVWAISHGCLSAIMASHRAV